MFVCSPQGLSVRSEPLINSHKIGGLKNFEKVFVYAQDKELTEINGVQNYWVKIKFKENFGWVFAAFLAENLDTASLVLSYEGHWIGDKVIENLRDEPTYYTQFDASKYAISLEFNGFGLDDYYDYGSGKGYVKKILPFYEYTYTNDNNKHNGIGSDYSISNIADGGERGGLSHYVYISLEDGKVLGRYEYHEAWYDGSEDMNVIDEIDVEYIFSYSKQ